MRTELRDHADDHQPRQWREQIHSGGLKIEQSANVAMPKKLTENHPAVKSWSQNRGQQGGIPRRKNNTHHLRCRDEFVVGCVVAMKVPRLLFSKVWVPLMIHCKRTIRAGAENTHTAQAAPVFLHLLFFVTAVIFQFKILALVFSICLLGLSSQVSAFRFALLDSVGACMSPCAVRRQHSEAIHCVSTAHIKHPVVLRLQEDVHFSHVMSSKYKHKFDESKKWLMRNGQANADSSGWTSLKKHDEQFTSSTHFRWCVRHDGDHESDDSASGICQQGSTQCGRTVWIRRTWKHHLQNGFSGFEHQKQNFWRCGTQRTCSNAKRRSLCVILSRSVIQNRIVRIQTSKICRQSSCERIFQGAQHLHEGRMEENERRATQVIGSDAQDAPRCQKKHMLNEHQVLLQAGDTEKESGALGATVTQCGSRRSWHEREVPQERISQNWESQQAQRRVLLQMEELLMTPLKDNSQEASESEMQAVVSTTVGDFSLERSVAGNDSLWFLGDRSNQTYHGSGGTKHEDSWKEHLYCSSVHLPPSRMECGQAPNARKSWFQPLWSAERNPWEHILLLYRTRFPSPMKVLRKGKEAEKFEFERWPQAAKFSSWKVSRSRLTTGSARPRLINGWSAEIALVSYVDELDHSRFTCDSAEVSIWNSGVTDCQENHEDCPAEVKRVTIYSAETRKKNKRPMLAGKHIMLHSFLHHQSDSRAHGVMHLTLICMATISRCSIWLGGKHDQPFVMIWMHMSWRTCMSDTWNIHHSWSMRLISAEHFCKRNREATND